MSTTYACKTCGYPVSANARRCPSCAEKRPAPTTENLVKSLIGLAVIVFFLIMLVAH